MMQCCLGALDTDDEDGTGGRRFDLPSRPLVIAFDWLGIEHRCAAAYVSKHWYEASEAAPLWAHWFLHMKDHWMKYDQDIALSMFLSISHCKKIRKISNLFY